MTSLETRYLELKRALFDKFYSDLNPEQRKAVYTVNGPLLILAGAGSGKTTVLVRRITYIIKYGNAYHTDFIPGCLDEKYVEELENILEHGSRNDIENTLDDFIYNPVPPYRVLAFTFTNKAANEIKNRLSAALDMEELAKDIWAGTFHSICMRILRSNCEKAGYKPGFTIYDTEDSKKAIHAAMKSLFIDDKMFPIKTVMAQISKAKDELLTPDEFMQISASDYRKSKVAAIYKEYQRKLEKSNCMDFDDIIMKTVLLFKNNPDILDYFRQKFKYVCVDEYQDTNKAQFVLTQLLSSYYNNIMVVGDDDQSIYRFRGATIENILSFDNKYEGSTVVKLEQNYRSTSNILNAANSVISNNNGRHKKTLWTKLGEGKKINIHHTEDQSSEARFIVDTVYRMVSQEGRKYKDFAVLYRVNAQSNSIEKAFAKSAIPYRLLGGTRFSDRKEIRDIVAYMQLVVNHADRERLVRIINEPKRKIGNVTLSAVEKIAFDERCTMFEVLEKADKYVALSRSASALQDFASLINKLTYLSETEKLPDFFDKVLELTGYRQMLVDGGEEEKERLENLDEFKSSIIEYANSNENPTLTAFLEETSLVADVDRYDESADAVVLMTIHSAKGLEFPVVFLPGMEEGIFPGLQNMLGSKDDMEEERRLAYVALTRAKEQIIILNAKMRLMYGQTTYNQISRFVREIPDEYKEEDDNSSTDNRSGSTKDNKPVNNIPRQRERQKPNYVIKDELTLGKPLINSNSNGNLEILKPGDRVKHMAFGEGNVLSVTKMGADMLYEVMFDKVGTKKLMGSYAKLKKI